MPRPTAVLLPGTGSDDVFVQTVFAGPLTASGFDVHTPPTPVGSALADGYFETLDQVADTMSDDATLLVGGISFGAQLATEWALRRPELCSGLLLALPAWIGDPTTAGASNAAITSADIIDKYGIDKALEISTKDVPEWLSAELTRAWHGHGVQLADNLRSAAARRAPTIGELRTVNLPVGIAACVDDPVHPALVAHTMADALPNATVVDVTMDDLGAARATLGRAALQAWRASRSRTPEPECRSTNRPRQQTRQGQSW